MTVQDNKNWFTECCKETGTAFSLEINSLLHQETTPFQKIEIYDTRRFGRLMVLDGFIMLSARDNFIYHEMMSHPTLFCHPCPKNVAIVGGGDCGTLQQVAKHSCVEKIIQIEIDQRVTQLSEQFFPELCTANQDTRVIFEYTDAIEWMKSADNKDIDVIIIDSTDPIGPAEGLFRKDFYHACLNALGNNGLIVQQSESPLAHWQSITQPMHHEMRAAGFSHTRTIFFPLPVYPTGWWSATIAAKNTIHLARDKQLDFATQYYNYDIHNAAFAMPEFLKNQ